MRRNSGTSNNSSSTQQTPSAIVSPTSSSTVPQIFYITHPTTEETEITLEPAQFDELSVSEKYNFFQHQAGLIKQLKRKIRKSVKHRFKVLRKSFARAEQTLKSSRVELKDQSELLSNFLQSIISGKLLPNSLPFCRLSTILRTVLKGDSTTLTEREREECEGLPKCLGVVDVLMGRNVNIEISPNEIAEQYLSMQSELIKKLTYPQFIQFIKSDQPKK